MRAGTEEASMATLYIASMGDAAGKSSLAAALGRKLQARGKKVGYVKALCGPGGGDPDAGCMKQLLGLEETVEAMCPVSATVEELAAGLDESEPSWLKSVRDACSSVSRGKDVVLVEGVSGFAAGTDAARIAGRTVEATKARAIVLVSPGPGMDKDGIVAAAKMLADNLLGVVINPVPEHMMESTKARLADPLEADGVKVLGFLPEDRALLGITVGALAEHIGGSILTSEDRSGELVESVMVGAMSVDSSLSYLGLKGNKAVVTRGDRPDIQLGALETSTKCLVITGNVEPVQGILVRARELDVPIVMVDKDTSGTMDALEDVFDRAQFCDEKKMERLGQVLEEHFDLEAVYAAV